MSIKEQIETLIIEAVKAGNSENATIWRSLKSAIGNRQIEAGHELSDEEVQAVIKKEHKRRLEAKAEFEKADRTDLSEKELKEAELFSQFLPEELDEAEIEKAVNRAIEQTGATSPADMGKVIGAAMSELKGRAEGGQVAEIAKRFLNS